jgi:beta-phosphoglucomutase-like phosphatase (HAD superfamily)
LKVRPGVLRLIEEARSLGEGRPKLAICSASTKTSCLFVLDNLLGPDRLSHFDLILAGDDVKNRKPDPEIYRLASQRCVGVRPGGRRGGAWAGHPALR